MNHNMIKSKAIIKLDIRILYFILMIPFFPPEGIIINEFISQVYWVAKLLAFVVILLLLIFGRKHSISIAVVFVIGMFGIQGLATAVNHGNIYKDINTFLTSVIFTLFVSWAIQKNCQKFLDATIGLVGTLATINLFTVLFIFEKGLGLNEVGHPIYFWSSDNHFASLLVIGIILAFVNNQIHNGRRKKSFIWITAIATITILKVWSATAVMGWFIIIIGLIYISVTPKFLEKINYFVAIIIGAILQIAFVIFRLQYLFEYVIVNILHKTLTFSRTQIWDFAINSIKKHPLLGLGNPSSFGINGWYLDPWSGYLFMHNEFLEWFVNGGIFAFISFVLFIVWPTSIMYKYRQRIEASALSLGVLSSIIMMITEGLTPRAPFIILMLLCYHVEVFIKSKI